MSSVVVTSVFPEEGGHATYASKVRCRVSCYPLLTVPAEVELHIFIKSMEVLYCKAVGAFQGFVEDIEFHAAFSVISMK